MINFSADHIIDMGQGDDEADGRTVAVGTLEEVGNCQSGSQ